jgi:predicted N-acetyltransferase YhbS
MENPATQLEGIGVVGCRISTLAGEMAAKQPEGVHAAVRDKTKTPQPAASTPPPAFDRPLPSRGKEGVAHFITAETAADIAAREALLDRAMGAGRKRKSSEKLRRGRRPSEGLAFVARDADGRLVGTVRLWDVAFARELSPPEGEMPMAPSTPAATPPPAFGRTLPSWGREGVALLLGPLAVEPALKNAGIGSALMRHAIAEARRLDHRAILLVGDVPYYRRFGFSAEKTGRLAMPGPYERHRFLALELEPGALDHAHGVLRAAGRKAVEPRQAGRTIAAA